MAKQILLGLKLTLKEYRAEQKQARADMSKMLQEEKEARLKEPGESGAGSPLPT
jgi:seryl-tRNA(Sec) selenium transferase